MASVGGAARKLTSAAGRAAEMTTEAAGAVGGAAVNGVIGGVKGTAAGVQRGLNRGSHSTPAAALTLGAIGVAGLVEWPILLGVGGAALLLRQLRSRPDPAPAEQAPPPTRLASVKPAKSTAGTRRRTPAKKPPTRQSRATPTRAGQ